MYVSHAARFAIAASLVAAVVVVGLPAVNATGQFADGSPSSGQAVAPPPTVSPNGHPWID